LQARYAGVEVVDMTLFRNSSKLLIWHKSDQNSLAYKVDMGTAPYEVARSMRWMVHAPVKLQSDRKPNGICPFYSFAS